MLCVCVCVCGVQAHFWMHSRIQGTHLLIFLNFRHYPKKNPAPPPHTHDIYHTNMRARTRARTHTHTHTHCLSVDSSVFWSIKKEGGSDDLLLHRGRIRYSRVCPPPLPSLAFLPPGCAHIRPADMSQRHYTYIMYVSALSFSLISLEICMYVCMYVCMCACIYWRE